MSDNWRMTHSINRRLTVTVIFTASASLFLACLSFLAYDVIKIRESIAVKTGTLAEVLGISERSVRRSFSFAKAWLYRYLEAERS